MLIPLSNNLFLTSDSKQYIIQKEKIRESGNNVGEKYMEDQGYYSSIPIALNAYKDEIIRSSDVKTFAELTKLLNQIRETLESIDEQLRLQ